MTEGNTDGFDRSDDEPKEQAGPYVTLPVGLYDQMARVYYLWRAGYMQKVVPNAETKTEEGVGVKQESLDPEPAGHDGEDVDRRITVAARPDLPVDYGEVSETDLKTLAQEAEDAERS